jgi:F-box protein 31
LHRLLRLDLDSMFKLDFSPRRSTLADLIRPGIFKGTYGPHGVELIALTYRKSSPTAAEPEVAEGIKLTGDTNVPFKEVTFRADLSQPIVYTNVEDQADVEAMIAGDTVPVVSPETPVDAMRQIFQLPESCRFRSSLQFDQCLARYKGECQIAGSDHQGPIL